MHLGHALLNLPHAKRSQVSSEIVTAVIVYYMNPENYQRYLLQKIHTSIGVKRKIFEFLVKLPAERIDEFSHILTE